MAVQTLKLQVPSMSDRDGDIQKPLQPVLSYFSSFPEFVYVCLDWLSEIGVQVSDRFRA